MTLNIADVRNRIAQRFPDVELVEDSVIRFTKTAQGRPFAVYYLDVAPTLPSTTEALTDYQDRVIGKHYFDGQKSLQWSNYLYFLVSPERLHDDATLKAKELIERDRSYARKCVITASELDAALQPPALPTIEDTPSVSIHSVWLKKLAEAGLEDAVLSDGTLPTRLALIETSSLAPQTTSQDVSQRQIAKALPFLRSLSLTDFRDFPAQRQFDLGTVNLIFGVNGSGKTSLLEAIELFYCGRNKRNPRVDLSYRIDVIYRDGTEESATNSRALQTFRDRNLLWYGQSEVKTNELYLSFGQFNFLDTDAAVAMSESTSLLEENLSKLLIGSQASKTSREMERVRDALQGKVRELQPLQVQIQSELAAIEAQSKQAGSTKHESDSLGERMKEMVRRSGWSVPADNTEQFAASLVESLSEFASLAEQAVAVEWAAAPVSVNGLLKYCRETTDLCNRADKEIASLKLLRNEETQAAETIKRCQALEKLAADAERLVALGVPNFCSELAKLTADIEKYRDALVGYDANTQVQPTNQGTTVALDEYSASVVTRRRLSEVKLTSAKEEHTNFAARRDHALSLAQQLRQIASEILQSSDKPDECPLCHSQFSAGELVEHIHQGVEADLEARAQQLLAELRTCEEELAADLGVERGTTWLMEFCKRKGLSSDVTVQEALAAVRTALVELVDSERRAEVVRAEVHAFKSQGLTAAMLTEIPEALRDLGQSLKAWSKEDVAILREGIERAHSTAVGELEPARRNADELQREINALLQVTESDIPTLQSTVSQLKERVATVESLITRLDGILVSFPWDSEKPLAELVVVVDSIRKVAGEFQSALGRERQSNAAIAEAAKRKEQLTTQLNSLTPPLSRFSEAQTALHDILEKHSLRDAMDSALKRHRAGIESIFARIHCPAEFSEVGEGFTTLVRKNNGSKATLSEISTGQRAALALSIFLAQNAQLSTAPPVVLIDDPIAHIDDLNSLSFLDYLRDLVLAGERQILFATASEKLASLFERKFDFLGAEQFRRHNLHRHPN